MSTSARSFVPSSQSRGRQSELESIEKTLLPNTSQTLPSDQSRHNLKIFVLHGARGSGKTELALDFVDKNRRDFDAVFFLKADTESRLRDQFCQIAVRLGLEPEDAVCSTECCEAAVIAWLKNPVKWVEKSNDDILLSHTILVDDNLANWLLVFDNVEKADVLSTFWPKAGKGSILITSLGPMTVSPFFCATASAELKVLPEEHAVPLLEGVTSSRDLEEDEDRYMKEGDTMHVPSKELVKKLQGLPLAIKQTSAITWKQRLNAQSCLKEYERRGDFDTPKGSHPRLQNYEDSLATFLAIDELEDSAKALVSVIALMDSGSIDEELLGIGFTLKCKIPHYPNSALALAAARVQLHRHSIISRREVLEPDGAVYKYSIHRLVQEVVRSKLAADNTISQAFRQVLASVDALWPWLGRNYVTGSAEKVDRWAACAKLVPHIQELATAYSKYFRDGEQHGFDITLAELLGEAGW